MTIADMQLREALVDARRMGRLAQQYEERLQAASIDGVHSPRLTGAPAGGGVSIGAARAVHIDALRRAAQGTRSEADIAQRRARRLLARAGYVGARMVFLDAYYCRAMTLWDAAGLAERSPRQCERYIHDLLHGDDWDSAAMATEDGPE